MGAARDDDFTAYVTAGAGRLRRTAYLLCGDWHRAEDIVQTALVRLYASWSRIHDPTAVDAYTRQVIVRVFLDERRRSWRRELPTERLPDAAVPESHAVEDRMVVVAALARVPARQRAVLVLRFWEDLPVTETARLLGCSEGTVKSQTSRGLAHLRAALARDGVVPPTLRGQLL